MCLYHRLVHLLQDVVLQNGSMTKLLKKDVQIIQWLVCSFIKNKDYIKFLLDWSTLYRVHYLKIFLWTDFDEIENTCKEGYPGAGNEYKLCRDVCKRDKPITNEISNACHASITCIGIFFAMFLTLFLK